MKIHYSDKLIAWLTLFSGLTISAVAIYYSVAGLVAIFAAAVVPIIVMGVALEISKLAATIWLKQNWKRAPRFIKGYLLAAIVILMFITSMGIFGFLSKAHTDQSLVSGDVQSKISVYDEKIRTSRDNIEAARKALKQMDDAVDQVMARSTSEQGADKAVQLRRQQARERTRLQNEIATEQKKIAQLNEEAAPIRAEVRKVEAEVGPIKYIAKLIYGDDPDQNLLEKAVTWVIMIIVIVFDPLAVILLLASQYSFSWFRQNEEEYSEEQKEERTEPPLPEPEDTEYVHSPWPFPVREEKIEEPDLVEEANAKLAEIEKEIDVEAILDTIPEEIENNNEDTLEIFESIEDSEKAAMHKWKKENPDGSLKNQRMLFKKGVIKELPWEKYITDRSSTEIEEAKKWAEEHPETEEAKAAEDWAKEQESISWMETDDQGNQIKKIKDTYQQNAEQSERTIWQRIQDAKK